MVLAIVLVVYVVVGVILNGVVFYDPKDQWDTTPLTILLWPVLLAMIAATYIGDFLKDLSKSINKKIGMK